MAPGVLKITYGLACCTMLLLLISFASPYWLQSWGKVHSRFVRLGLWEVCLNEFSHPKDSLARVYSGCKWILDADYFYFRFWLIPPWFIVVMIIASLAFITGSISFILFTLVYMQASRQIKLLTIYAASAFMVLTAGLQFATIFLFGIFGFGPLTDWEWMEYPAYNYLGWSYGLAVCAVVFAIATIYAAYKYHKVAVKNKPASVPPLPQSEKAELAEQQQQQFPMRYAPPPPQRYPAPPPQYHRSYRGQPPPPVQSSMVSPQYRPSGPPSQHGGSRGPSVTSSRQGSVQQLPMLVPASGQPMLRPSVRTPSRSDIADI